MLIFDRFPELAVLIVAAVALVIGSVLLYMKKRSLLLYLFFVGVVMALTGYFLILCIPFGAPPLIPPYASLFMFFSGVFLIVFSLITAFVMFLLKTR